MNNILIPTHFRFLDKKEAKNWDRTTKDWIPISEIHIQGNEDYYDISSAAFAWVSYNVKKPNLEFKNAKFTKNDLEEFNDE